MRKRILCFCLAVMFALLCGGCNLRGATTVLDNYSVQRLYDTYKAVTDGSLKISVNRTETIPAIRTTIVDDTKNHPNRAALYFYNESVYHVTVHGYAWIAQADDITENAYKAIYFNNEKEVANASYEVRVDPGRNTYLLYELLDNSAYKLHSSAIYFIFFKYEETEYAGAATVDGFVFWPLNQTVKS